MPESYYGSSRSVVGGLVASVRVRSRNLPQFWSALDDLVRVVERDGWVIFSVRDDVYHKEGFEEKQASLEKEGRWQRVTMSEAFQPFPSENTSHVSCLFVYKTR